ncbi:MAG TPA: hypothetical protein VN868_11720 [Terriglobales bacterium]|nr:hypothetical protein [Terriglobales bacterium]
MTSEKAMYWMAVGVLAVGALNGLVNRVGELVPWLADRSLALVSQASQTAADYVETARMTLGGDHLELAPAPMAVVRAQTGLASIQATLARNQAALDRVQAQRLRVRVLGSRPRSWPGGHVVIDLPQPPQIEQDGTF